MDNRYEIAEQNGMSREFADWFFDNKKAGCGNVWFMMMAAMWEGWQGRAAMLQGADGNSPVIPDGWKPAPVEPTEEMIMAAAPNCTDAYDYLRGAYKDMIAAAPAHSRTNDGWVACSERMPEQFVEVLACTEDGGRYVAALNQRMTWDDGDFFDDIQDVTHWQPLPSPPAK